MSKITKSQKFMLIAVVVLLAVVQLACNDSTPKGCNPGNNYNVKGEACPQINASPTPSQSLVEQVKTQAINDLTSDKNDDYDQVQRTLGQAFAGSKQIP